MTKSVDKVFILIIKLNNLHDYRIPGYFNARPTNAIQNILANGFTFLNQHDVEVVIAPSQILSFHIEAITKPS